ncbi:MAG: RDD family protein [Armatimonadota bacterium]|nr:RDD family protein [Armatimonadota bacterium]
MEISYEIAGLGSRFVAALIDTVVQLAVLAALLIGFASTAQIEGALRGYVWWQLAIVLLAVFAIFPGYFIFFETAWNGQTPGKRAVGIRVVRDDGRPVGFAQAAIRNVVRLVDFLPLSYGVGVITMLLNRAQRRLGDFAAGTIVIHDAVAQRPRALRTTPVPPGRVPPRRLRPQEYELVRRFLLRRTELAPDARAQRAREIAQALGVDGDTGTSAEELLEALAASHRGGGSGHNA